MSAGVTLKHTRERSRLLTCNRHAFAAPFAYPRHRKGWTQCPRKNTPRGLEHHFYDRRFVMRRVTALCAAAGIAVSGLASPASAQAGYYVLRWDNTGVCQIWNQDLTFKRCRWPSDYKVVSKPVPTLAAAMAVQETMAAAAPLQPLRARTTSA